MNLPAFDSNQTKKILITLNYMENLVVGNYMITVSLVINGKNYGKKIAINIIVKRHQNEAELVKKFREYYSLDNSYSNEMILSALREGKNRFLDAYQLLFSRLK